MRLLKFLTTGAIGISVNLGAFYLLHQTGIADLVGSPLALSVSTVVGFLLQKYWTFEERSSARTRTQFLLYAALAVGNLVVNTFIVHMLITDLDVYYLIAQTIGAAIIAVDSYAAYHFFIFKIGAPDTNEGAPEIGTPSKETHSSL